jgi:ribose-phosphate pyrophosphokinase
VIVSSFSADSNAAESFLSNAKAILGDSVDIVLDHPVTHVFPDGEVSATSMQPILGRDVFVVGNYVAMGDGTTTNDRLMLLLATIRMYREAGARQIVAVCPYLSYTRQDRPADTGSVCVTARLVSDLIHMAGADRLVAWHVGNKQVLKCFGSSRLTGVTPEECVAELAERLSMQAPLVLVAPDQGGQPLVEAVANRLGLIWMAGRKVRLGAASVQLSLAIEKDAGPGNFLVVDDLIASGATMEAVVRRIHDRQPEARIFVYASHAIGFLGGLEKLHSLKEACNLDRIYLTNAVRSADAEAFGDWVHVVDVSRWLASQALGAGHAAARPILSLA